MSMVMKQLAPYLGRSVRKVTESLSVTTDTDFFKTVLHVPVMCGRQLNSGIINNNAKVPVPPS